MNLRPLFAAIGAGIVLLLLIEAVAGGYSDVVFGFYAWFGFCVCVGLVGGALALGKLIKRKDDYYDDPKAMTKDDDRG